MVKVSIVIPARNESKNIPILISKISKSFRNNKIDGEIVLVDDGSTDGTKGVTENLKYKYKFLRVYSHPVGRGLTNTLLTSFEHARGEIIIFLPADLESDPEEDIPLLLNEMSRGYDMVCGWRQNRKGVKIFISKFYNILSRTMFRNTIHDLNWIKAFRTEVIKNITLKSDWHRYLAILAQAKGYKVGEVKVNAYPRKYGKSKFGMIRLLIGMLDLIAIKFHLSFTERPMLVFGSVGFLLVLIGSGIGAYVTYLAFLLDSVRLPLASLSVLFILMGIQIFVMGFLSEYLSCMKSELERIKKNR